MIKYFHEINIRSFLIYILFSQPDLNFIRAEAMLSTFFFFMVFSTKFHMLKKSSMIFVNHLVY